MPSFDDRPYSSFDSSLLELSPSTLAQSPSSSEARFTVPLPGITGSLDQRREQEDARSIPFQFPHVTTPQLPFPSDSNFTRVLSETLSGNQDTTGMRKAIVIKAEMKKRTDASLSHTAHKKRRLLVSLAGVLVLLLITTGTLLAASPMGHDMGMNFGLQQSGSSLIAGANNSPNLIAQATATAVYHRQTDGYDPSSRGVQTVNNSGGSLNWPLGQCTFWANYRYHQITGHWVAWDGNADQWVVGARSAGWNVSQVIHVPSIIVLMPYVQGASGYGHVAVVESATGSTAHTSDMNWWANGGGWDKVSDVDFTTGSGVWFVWHS